MAKEVDQEYTNDESKKTKRAIAKLLIVHKQIQSGKKFKIADVAGSISLINTLLPEEWQFKMGKTMSEFLRHKNTN